MVVSLQSSSNETQPRETEVVNETKNNFKTKIGKKYSAKDVIKVWDCISKWIENNMNQDKGVLIKGIGYFTFAQWMLNVGKGYPYTMRKPVFVVDEKLARDYNLKRRRPYNTGNIHERYLNLSSVAQDFQLNIDMVTHCFKEVVTAFRKLLYEKKNCELPFSNIGKLQIKNKIITMRFYQEFLERQNQELMDRTKEEKKKYQAAGYNPDWDADQYENQGRPCSAMSTINRPASSLSQYRPGTGYNGVLPDINDTTTRPDSRLSTQSRPDSRLSIQSRPDSRLSTQSRPGSRLSTQSRPDSRLSTQSRPGSRLSTQSRPGSRLSTQFRPSSRLSVQSRPGSRLSAQSRLDSLSVQCSGSERTMPMPGSSVGPGMITRPGSRLLNQSCDQNRPTSKASNRCQSKERNNPPSRSPSLQSIALSTTRPTSSARPTSRSKKTDDVFSETAIDGPSGDCPNPKLPTSNTTVDENGKKIGICEKMTLTTKSKNYDESLCCSCNIRKLRFEQMEIKNKTFLPSTDSKDDFMKGDNLLNRLIHSEIENKRKNQIKEISNYNYATANELLNTVNEEKNKRRSERNVDDSILIKRPTSISKSSDKRTNLKHVLLNQIECNKIKTEADKIASLKNEQQMQEEFFKKLHEERMMNIEAKARSKENYLIILNDHMKKKNQIAEEVKKKDNIMFANTILGTDEVQSQKCAKLNKHKNRELANYQLKQRTARNLADLEQKEKIIDFERNLLNQIKEEDEKLRTKLLQKKLNQKKFLTEDLSKLLAKSETERRKNQIPNAYPMTFPLKKMANRCRLCKKNGLRFPMEKITDSTC